MCLDGAAKMMKWLPYPRLDVPKAGGKQLRPTLSLQAFESDRILMSAQARDVVVVQSPSHVRLFVTPWTAARQASLTLTVPQSLPKFMSIELVMPSNHLILCHTLLLLPSIFPGIREFSNESFVCIR